MKRIIILFLFSFLVGINTFAQPTQRQKMIHMAAVRIADQIEVKAEDKEAFITLYQSYKKESAGIMKIQPAPVEDSEAAAEAKILSDFEKSQKILSLRKAYYSKFRTILSPSQIQKMYDVERAAFAK